MKKYFASLLIVMLALSSCSGDDDDVLGGGGAAEVLGKTPAGLKAVDLGLPSGLKWANMNLGAEKATDNGDKYAWGEIKTKNNYTWDFYMLCEGTYKTMTKYCASHSYGPIDNLLELALIDDAAHANWGGKWRMPTEAEVDELRDNCYFLWTDNYDNSGEHGYIVYKAKSTADKGIKVSNTDTSAVLSNYTLSDTHIFIPTTFYSAMTQEHYGRYWTSSLYESKSYGAWFFPIDVYFTRLKFTDRCEGYPIRAVCK